MNGHMLLWVSTFALAAVTGATGAAAQQDRERDPLLGSEFVDMPDEYYEQKKVEQQERQRELGDVKEEPGYLPGYRRISGLGLSPHAPQRIGAMPGAVTPSFGAPTRHSGLRFDFHGYVQPVLRAGIGQSEYGEQGNKNTTVHGDPVVPGGAYGWFDHSNTVPTPWAQLNFSYGNQTVRGTVILGAWSAAQADEAAGFFRWNAQMLFSHAYITYTPDVEPVRFKIDFGVFPDRYGFMAKWHQGAYGTSLIADINGVGATAHLELPFEGDFTVITEAGFKGELDKAPIGMPQDGSNEHSRSEEGSTFAGHGHLALEFLERYTLAFHFIHSWSQDDRGDPKDVMETGENESHERKDGFLRIIGADLRIDAKRFGYLYLGASRVEGKHANSITDLVRVLNAGSGYELNERYWGFSSGGNGKLTLAGMQYTLSLGTLLRHPMEYWGVGPDLSISLFGIFGRSESGSADMGDRNMLKYGCEATYSIAPYLAAALRFDHVMPDLAEFERSFAVISPKIILRSDWITRESITVQYAYYALGNDVQVQGDNRLMNIASKNPDHHMVAIFGTIWW